MSGNLLYSLAALCHDNPLLRCCDVFRMCKLVKPHTAARLAFLNPHCCKGVVPGCAHEAALLQCVRLCFCQARAQDLKVESSLSNFLLISRHGAPAGSGAHVLRYLWCGCFDHP